MIPTIKYNPKRERLDIALGIKPERTNEMIASATISLTETVLKNGPEVSQRIVVNDLLQRIKPKNNQEFAFAMFIIGNICGSSKKS